MKVKVSKMSKFTAVLVAMIMVISLAFSMMAYFGNNQGAVSTPVVGSGSVSETTAGAGFDMASATPIDSSMLVSNGASAAGSGVNDIVTMSSYINRDGGKATSFNDKGGANTGGYSNRVYSHLPTKYLQLPSYGAFDLTPFMSKAGREAADNRLFGTEAHNGIVYTSADAAAGTGFKVYPGGSEGYDWTRGSLTYFTVALPDNMVAGSQGASLHVSFKWQTYSEDTLGNGRRMGTSLYVLGETGDTGINAKLGATGTSPMGFHGDTRYGFSNGDHNPSLDTLPAGSYYICDGKSKKSGEEGYSNIAQHNKGKFSGTFNNSFPILAGTRYIRFAIAVDVFDGSRREVNASFGDFKIMVKDNKPDMQVHVYDNDVSKNWSEGKDIDVSINNFNGNFTKDQIANLDFNVTDPCTGEVKKYTYGSTLKDTSTKGADDLIYIKDKDLGYTFSNVVGLDGRLKSQAYTNNGKGFNMKLHVRSGVLNIKGSIAQVKLPDNLNFHYDGKTNIMTLDGTSDNAVISHIDSGKTNSKYTPAVKIVNGLVKLDDTTKFKVSLSSKDGHDIDESLMYQRSPETIYYYELGDTTEVDDATLKANGTALITGDSTKKSPELPLVTGQINNVEKEIPIANRQHGKINYVFFTRDKFNNISRLKVGDETEATNGVVTFIIDGSAIDATTSIATVTKDTITNASNEATWTKNNISIKILAKPTSDAFVAGVRAYIKMEDLTKTVNNIKYQLVDLATPESGGLSGEFTFTENGYTKISVTLYNKIDDTRTNQGQIESSLPKPEVAKTAININKSSGNEATYILRKDTLDPVIPVLDTPNSGEWLKGVALYTMQLSNANTTPMFKDPNAKVKIQFKANANQWLDIDGDVTTAIAKTGNVQLYLGKAWNTSDENTINKSIPIKAANQNLNDIESFNGKISFRVKYPNAPDYANASSELNYYYYDFIASDNHTVTEFNDLSTVHNLKLDNVKPVVNVTAKYVEADLYDIIKSKAEFNTVDKQKTALKAAIKILAGLTVQPEPQAITVEGVKLGDFVVKEIPDNTTFWGTPAITVDITNYKSILSNELMSNSAFRLVTDLFNPNGNEAIIYDKTGGEIAGNSSKTYLTFASGLASPEIDIFNRGLGFKVVTGSGVETVVDKNVVMDYNNSNPYFEIKINNASKPTLSGEYWFNDPNYRATIEDKSSAIGVVGSSVVNILAECWPGQTTAGDAPMKQNLTTVDAPLEQFIYDGTIGTLTNTTDGAFTYRITATTKANRTYQVTLIIGLDRNVDPFAIKNWTKPGNTDGVRYVRASADGIDVSFDLAVDTPKVSDVHYYIITSPLTESILIDNDVIAQWKAQMEAETAVELKFVEGSKEAGDERLAYNNIDIEGNKYVYILANDQAGNIYVVGSEGFKAVYDTKSYSLDVSMNIAGKGGFSYIVIDRADNSETTSTTYSSAITGLKAGQQVKLTAAANDAGKIFLGYSDVVCGAGDPVQPADNKNANATTYIDINYNTNTTYKVMGVFKTKVQINEITNTIWRAPIIHEFQVPALKGTMELDGNPIDGTGMSKDLSAQIGDGKILKIKWKTGSVPNDYGAFEYEIIVNPDLEGNTNEYFLVDAFAGNVIITARAVLNVVFDQSNPSKEYVYEAAPFLTKESGVNTLGGSFIANFFGGKHYGKVVNEENMDKTEAFANMLNGTTPWGAGKEPTIITLKADTNKDGKIDGTDAEVTSVQNVGIYQLYIKHVATDQNQKNIVLESSPIDWYDVEFTLDFKVTARPLNIVANPSPDTLNYITKVYDGNNETTGLKTPAGNWEFYLDVASSNVAGSDNLNDILDFTNFVFEHKNINCGKASITGIKVKPEATNYTIASGEVTVDFIKSGMITKKPISLVYNADRLSPLYTREYNGNDRVKVEDSMKHINVLDGYWTAETCLDSYGNKEQLIFEFRQGAIHLGSANVSDNNKIVVNAGEFELLNYGKTLEEDGAVVNYEIVGAIEITGVKITRATLTIAPKTGFETSSEFTGSRFKFELQVTGLQGTEDKKFGEYGMPLIFDNIVTYTNTTTGDSVKIGDVGADTYPWDVGVYTITIGESAISGSEVNVGTNYRIDSVLNFNYEVIQKKLYIVFDDINENPTTFKNAKFFDNLPIGGDQIIYSKKDFKTDKYNLDFVINDGVKEVGLPKGYRVEFSLHNDNVDANDTPYYLQVTKLPVIYFNDTISTNYSISFLNDIVQYKIIKRELKVNPLVESMGYDAGAEEMGVDVINASQMNILVGEADGTYLAPEEGSALLDAINYASFVLHFTMKTIGAHGEKNALDANWALNGSGEGYVAKPSSSDYYWAVSRYNGKNFTIIANKDNDVAVRPFIKQAEYFIELDKVDDTQIFNDSSSFAIPTFAQGDGYNIYSKQQGLINGVELPAIKFYKHYIAGESFNNDGTAYTGPQGKFLDAVGDYGVGTYSVVFASAPTPSTNYKIVNVKVVDELNVIFKIDAKLNPETEKQEYFATENKYQTIVTPVVVTITRNAVTAPFDKNTVGDLRAAFSYTTNNDNKGIQNSAKRDLLGSIDNATGKMNPGTKVFLHHYAGGMDNGLVHAVGQDTTPLGDEVMIDAGEYCVNFDEFTKKNALGGNYKVQVGAIAIHRISKINIYIKSDNSTKVYDGEAATVGVVTTEVAVPDTKPIETETVVQFYDQYGKEKIIPDDGTPYKITLKVNDDAKAINVGTYPILIDNAAAGYHAPTGNYVLDEANPFLAGTTTKFKITPHEYKIDVARVDGTTGADAKKAEYGKNGFKMKTAFNASITDKLVAPEKTGFITKYEALGMTNPEATALYNALVKTINDYDTAVNKIMATPGFIYNNYAGPNADTISYFDIDFIEQNKEDVKNISANFSVVFSGMKGFELTKQTITANITGTSSAALGEPNRAVQYADGLNIGVDAYEIHYTLYNPASTKHIDIDASISEYLAVMPEKKIKSSIATEQGTPFEIYADNSGKLKSGFVTVGGGDDITFLQAYRLVSGAKDTFVLTKKAIELDLVIKDMQDPAINKDGAAKTGVKNDPVYIYGGELVGGDKFFNPKDIASYEFKLTTGALVTGDKLAVDGMRISSIDFVPETVIVDGTAVVVVTVKFNFNITNQDYYDITFKEPTQIGGAKVEFVDDTLNKEKYYAKKFYVAKADAKITISQKNAETLTYGKTFFDNFEGAVEGLKTFESISGLLANITPDNMKFTDLKTNADNANMADATIVLDDKVQAIKDLQTELNKFYNVTIVGKAVTFNKGSITIGGKGYSKTYSVNNVAKKTVNGREVEPGIKATFANNMHNVVSDRDKEYIYNVLDVDTLGNKRYKIPTDDDFILLFTKTADTLDYKINTLNVTGAATANPAEYFKVNNDVIKADNPLFVFNFAESFKINIEKCLISIGLLRPMDKAGNVLPYTFEYGTTRDEIAKAIRKQEYVNGEFLSNVKITYTDGTKEVILNNGTYDSVGKQIINPIVNLDTTSITTVGAGEKDVFDASTFEREIKFTLAANEVANNYQIKNDSKKEIAPIKITPKRLYVKASKGGTNVLFTSVFGDIVSDTAQAKLLADRAYIDGNIDFTWYEAVTENGVTKYVVRQGNGKVNSDGTGGSLVYASDLDNKITFSRAETNWYAFSYPINLDIKHPNYEVTVVPELNGDGTAKKTTGAKPVEILEKFIYTITTRTVDLLTAPSVDAVGVQTNESHDYGASYQSIIDAHSISELLAMAMVKDWENLDPIVRNEVLARVSFSLDIDPAITGSLNFNASTYIVDCKAGGYVGSYKANYDKNIVPSITINHDAIAYMINKLDIGKNIFNENVESVFNNAWHDDNFSLIFKDPVTGKANPVMSNKVVTIKIKYNGGAEQDFISKDTSIVDQARLMKNAGTYTIVVKVSDKDIKSKDGNSFVKINATNNYTGEFSFDYVIKKVDFNKLVSSSTAHQYDFNGSLQDDRFVYSLNTLNKLFDDKAVKVTIDGKDWINKVENEYGDLVRMDGLIKNVKYDGGAIADYVIKVELIDTSLFDNINKDAPFIFNLKIVPHEVEFTFTDNEYNKTYGEVTDVLLADNGIQEFYAPGVPNYSRTYTTVDGKPVPDITLANVGEYIVTFHMNDNTNYTARYNDRQFKFVIAEKNIDYYLTKHTKDPANPKDTTLETPGVTLKLNDALRLEGNTYKQGFAMGGIVITPDTIDNIFGKYAKDVTGYEIRAILDNEYVATNHVGEAEAEVVNPFINLNKAGWYTIRIYFTTNDNVGFSKTYDNIAKANVNKYVDLDLTVLRISANDVNDSIVIDRSDVVVDKNGINITFDGKTPSLPIKFEQGDSNVSINYDEKKDIQYFVFKNDTWEATKSLPTNVGKYKAVIDIDNDNIKGKKELVFVINPITVSGNIDVANSDAKSTYGNEYKITYHIDEAAQDFLTVNYYRVDGAKETKLDGKPTDSGKYVVKVEPTDAYKLQGEVQNVVLDEASLASAKFEYSIAKANYNKSNVSITKYAGSKLYDGKPVTVSYDSKLVRGLPEDAKVTLKTSGRIKDAKEYKLTISVESNNYNTFTMPYGTYTVAKASITPVVEEKTMDSITIKAPTLVKGTKVTYYIDGEENEDGNVFSNLEPNKEYTITLKVTDARGKVTPNYDNNGEFVIKVMTGRKDVVKNEQIAGVAVAGVAAVSLTVVLGVILGIRKRRKV